MTQQTGDYVFLADLDCLYKPLMICTFNVHSVRFIE